MISFLFRNYSFFKIEIVSYSNKLEWSFWRVFRSSSRCTDKRLRLVGPEHSRLEHESSVDRYSTRTLPIFPDCSPWIDRCLLRRSRLSSRRNRSRTMSRMAEKRLVVVDQMRVLWLCGSCLWNASRFRVLGCDTSGWFCRRCWRIWSRVPIAMFVVGDDSEVVVVVMVVDSRLNSPGDLLF